MSQRQQKQKQGIGGIGGTTIKTAAALQDKESLNSPYYRLFIESIKSPYSRLVYTQSLKYFMDFTKIGHDEYDKLTVVMMLISKENGQGKYSYSNEDSAD